MNTLFDHFGMQRSPAPSSLFGLTMMAAGVLLGSAVTLLLAPRLRREIRDELAERARRLRENMPADHADRVLTEM